MEEDTDAWLCACKHTHNAPYCDVTHQTFSDDRVGHEGPGVRKNEDAAPEPKATAEEPAVELIHHLARQGLQGVGLPAGFKMSANHIERDIEFALQTGADDIILDGRDGGTGAAPLLFRDYISVPTLPALVRARHYLDKKGASGRVTPIIKGIRRTGDGPEDVEG